MKIQEGAGHFNLRHEIRQALLVVDYVVRQVAGIEPTLTFGTAGEHGPRSLHPKRRAIDVDWAPWDGPPSHIKEIREAVAFYLGRDFDVVEEDTHLHVEHDPKY